MKKYGAMLLEVIDPSPMTNIADVTTFGPLASLEPASDKTGARHREARL